MELSVARFCNLVHHWSTRAMKNEEELQRFENWLTAAPSGDAPSDQLERASGVWSREAELAQFNRASG